jgi:hypothetical protein
MMNENKMCDKILQYFVKNLQTLTVRQEIEASDSTEMSEISCYVPENITVYSNRRENADSHEFDKVFYVLM